MSFVRVFPDPEAMALEIAQPMVLTAHRKHPKKKMCLPLFYLEGQRL